jgi:NADH dehydrogenase
MALQTNSDTLITVFGGSGFLGRHVVRALAKRRYRIRVAVRRPELAGHLQPLGTVGQIHAVQANLRYPASVEAAVRNASIAINLVGILFERGRQDFEAVQHFGAEQVALAANAHGARLLHVSAIGADEHSPSLYAQSKARGEQAVRAASPDAVIVRPSVVFGPEDDFFNRFGSLARFLPALPLIGGGHTRLQPVFAGDVAEAIADLVQSGAGAGKTYEFGGPDVRTMREIMEYILAVTERSRLLIPLPFGLAKMQAWFLQFLPNPPLTPDQVELSSPNLRSAITARFRASALPPPPTRRSRRIICGASAGPASSAPAASPDCSDQNPIASKISPIEPTITRHHANRPKP